jgi:tripartite-type tricarboxylate transporter receptor subunit TctC
MTAVIVMSSVAAGFVPGTSRAQDPQYPSKVVRITVPQAPGGAVDLIARMVAEELRRSWNQPVIVENRAGAGGNLAATFVARSPADGYNLLVIALTTYMNALFSSDLPYVPMKDFAPIAQFIDVPFVLIANPKAPYNTVGELVAFAKRNPGKINFASFGTAQSGHLAGELFKMTAGVDITHIPYKGGAAAQPAVMSGEVDVMFDPSALSLIRGGKVKAIAVTTLKRSSLLPGVPTIAESGYPGFNVSTWTGLAAPTGTPRPIIERINREVVRAFADGGSVRDRMLNTFGQEPVGGTPEQFEATIADSMKVWGEVVRRTGVKPD